MSSRLFRVHPAQEPVMAAFDTLLGCFPNCAWGRASTAGFALVDMYQSMGLQMSEMSRRLLADYPIEAHDLEIWFTNVTSAVWTGIDAGTWVGVFYAHVDDETDPRYRWYGGGRAVGAACNVVATHGAMAAYPPADPPDLRGFLEGIAVMHRWMEFRAWWQTEWRVRGREDELRRRRSRPRTEWCWDNLANQHTTMSAAAGQLAKAYRRSAQHELARFDQRTATTHLTNVGRY